MRGVGYSPYHPRHGFELPRAVRALDRRLILGLNANCVLTWGPTSFEDVASWRKVGVYTLPQVVYSPPKLSFFPTGQSAPVPVYVSEENRQGLHDAVRDLGSALKGSRGVLAISLGNQYAWSAFSGDLGFSYGGFDEETVAAFRARLKQRFSSVEQFNELAGHRVANLDGVLPAVGLSPSPAFWEWWLFMQEAFAGYLKSGQEGLAAVGWTCPTTYARPCGVRWDPASEGGPLPSVEIVSGNVFRKDARSWGGFCVTIDRLVSRARGRPVLVTETGAHTLHTDENEAARTLKQSIACALLHPELAGVGVYEYCDEWHHSGQPDVHDDMDDREHWGLVTGRRAPKRTYHAAKEMFAFIERNERLFEEWQSPPAVLLSQQDLDWWKARGLEGVIHEAIAVELYRQGVSFRLVDSEGLLQLDPHEHPRLILCDTYLCSNPDGTQDVQGSIVSYIENGGNVLYVSRAPWQRLYGRSTAPEELRPASDRGPASRDYGKGHITIVPTHDLTEEKVRYLVEDYLAETLKDRPVMSLEAEGDESEVFWRMFEAQDGLWLLAVNVGTKPIRRLRVQLGRALSGKRAALRGGDGAQSDRVGKSLYVAGLNTYALIYLGRPLAVPAPGAAITAPRGTEPGEGTPVPGPEP